MEEKFLPILVLAGMWLAYFTLHSILASLALKHWIADRWPAFMPAYRLGFNIAALILLIAVLAGVADGSKDFIGNGPVDAAVGQSPCQPVQM